MLKSTDGGATWSPLDTGIEPFVILAIDPLTLSTLCALTNYGAVLKSTDRGATWVKTGALAESCCNYGTTA